MDKKEKALKMISNYFSKYLLLIMRIGERRDCDALLFKFVYLGTLKELIEETDESQIDDLVIIALATMEIVTEEIETHLGN